MSGENFTCAWSHNYVCCIIATALGISVTLATVFITRVSVPAVGSGSLIGWTIRSIEGLRIWTHLELNCLTCTLVPAGSSPRGGDVVVCVFWQKPSELGHSFLFCSCVYFFNFFIALSTVFHSINSPDNSQLPYSVLPVLIQPFFGPFSYISHYESLTPPWYNPLWLTGLKAPTN